MTWPTPYNPALVRCDRCPAEPREFAVYPVVVYLCCWAVPFYLLVFVALAGYIKRNKKETLFTYLLEGEMLGPVLRSAPVSLQPLAYMAVHCISVVLFR